MAQMRNVLRLSFTLTAMLAVGACSVGSESGESEESAGSKQSTAFHAPLYFVPNHGQIEAPAAFYVQGRDATVMFGEEGLTYWLRPQSASAPPSGPRARGLSLVKTAAARPEPETMTLEFVGANLVEPEGQQETGTKMSFFRGQEEARWRTSVPSFAGVVYRDLWPGIDLVYSGEGGRLKYSFLVSPGANPALIRLAYHGARSVQETADGELEIQTATRTLYEAAPLTLQNDIAIQSSYVTYAPTFDASGNVFEYGFEVGAYDTTKALLIDPPAFVYAGFLGGTTEERGLGITVDAAGAAYITGQTARGVAPFDDDVFIAKVKADGTGYDWVALYGGAGWDEGFDIAVNSLGQTFVTGFTSSTNLPVGVGPDTSYNGGPADCFIAKINATGTALVYAGFVGGNGADFCEGVVVDSAGNAYIEGPTNTSNASMPTTVGPDLTYNGGDWDTFVAKIIPVPNKPTVKKNYVYFGYIGGADSDAGDFDGFITDGHIAIDSSGAAYVSGMTKSTEATFPNGSGFGAIPGADHTHGGDWDGYVVKVNASGTGFAYATYVGGAGLDRCFGMKADSSGRAYFTGSSTSSEATLPVVGGPDLTYNGNRDAIVGRLNAAGTAFDYLGYIGGTGEEEGDSVALDGNGNVYIAGYADSADGSFPAVAGPDLTENDAVAFTGDAFIARMKPTPTDPDPVNNYDYAGFIGGDDYDQAFWVAVDSAGNAYVVGDTYSTEATFPNGSGLAGITSPDNTAAGLGEAFVVKISP